MSEKYNEHIDDIINSIDINSPPPTEEPMRQYYFIAKMREWVRAKSKELGRPLSASTVCMGCPIKYTLLSGSPNSPQIYLSP